jgi:hypothetical protein
VPHPKVKIADNSGNEVSVTDNRLDVNAELIVGDVNVGNIDVLSVIPGTGATNLGKAEDDSHTSGDVGVMTLGVRNDTLAALGGDVGDYAPLQLNASGALYVDIADGGTVYADDTVWSSGKEGNYVLGVRNDQYNSLVSADERFAPLQINSDGALYTNAFIDTTAHANNAFNIASAPTSASQRGIVPLVKMNEVVVAPSGHADNDWTYFQTDLNGSLYTTHGITGAASSKNTTVGTSIEDLHGTSDVACKRIDMMASPNNTGYIWVGGTSTAVGAGIRLAPGDFYSVDIDNTDDIQVIATVDGEDIHYTIFT